MSTVSLDVWQAIAIGATSLLVGVLLGAVLAESLGLVRELRMSLRKPPEVGTDGESA